MAEKAMNDERGDPLTLSKMIAVHKDRFLPRI